MTQGINISQLERLLGGRRASQIRQVARYYGGGNLHALWRIFDAGVKALAASDIPSHQEVDESSGHLAASHISGYGE